MAWFNRKKQNEVLPDEVQDYYKAEQRDRIGVAWLLAAGAFILTVAIIIGLFFAGRWAYQSIFSSDPDTTSEVEEVPNDGLPGFTEEEAGPEGSDQSGDTTDSNDDAPTGNGDDSGEATEPTGSAPGETTESSPVTGGSSSSDEEDELPRTGPSSN